MASTQKLPEICLRPLSEVMQPELFKALSDPTRISIISLLATRRNAASVSDVSACCGIDFSGVSRHLTILRDANILMSEKKGREVFYSLNLNNLTKSLRAIADALQTCADKTI